MTSHCLVTCSHRSFVIQQIPSSNLFMVVVDSSCLCESVAPITMAPIEIRYILFIVWVQPAAATGKGETTGRKLEGDVPKREGLHPLPMYGEKCLSYLVPSFDPWNSEWEKQPSETCLNYSQHNESLKCERLKAQKIRRRPESCHGFHPEASLRTISILFPIRFTMSTSWWPGTTAETWLMRKYFLSES